MLQKILFNDWSFVLTESPKTNISPKTDDNKNQKNQFTQAFSTIFNLKRDEQDKDVLEILRFVALLKPDNCNIKLSDAKFGDYINPATVRAKEGKNKQKRNNS